SKESSTASGARKTSCARSNPSWHSMGGYLASARRLPAAPSLDLIALLAQKRPIDLFGIQIDVPRGDPAGLEVLLPTLDHPGHGADFPDRVILAKRKHLTHGQCVRERRVSLLLADPHLLEAERLP